MWMYRKCLILWFWMCRERLLAHDVYLISCQLVIVWWNCTSMTLKSEPVQLAGIILLPCQQGMSKSLYGVNSWSLQYQLAILRWAYEQICNWTRYGIWCFPSDDHVLGEHIYYLVKRKTTFYVLPVELYTSCSVWNMYVGVTTSLVRKIRPI